jgi:hypothetical protein
MLYKLLTYKEVHNRNTNNIDTTESQLECHNMLSKLPELSLACGFKGK